MHVRVNNPLAIALIGIVFVAGCTAPAGSSNAKAPSPLVGTVGGGEIPLLGQPLPFNLTSCKGATLKLRVPHEVVRGALPPAFDAFQQYPGLSMIVIQTMLCDKLARDGQDVGPASFSMSFVPLKNPSSAPTPAGWGPAYLLEIGSSDASLLAAARVRRIPNWNCSYSGSVTPFPITFETVVGTLLTNSQDTLLSFEIRPSPFSKAIQEKFRMFYGDNPNTGFLNVTAVGADSSGDGPGTVKLVGATKAKAAAANSPEAIVNGMRIHDRNIEIWGFAAVEG